MAAPHNTKPRSQRRGSSLAGQALGSVRIQHALSSLKAKGLVGKNGSTKVSARLDSDLLAAARAKIGAKTDTELLTAALAIVAGDDDFGAWLVTRGERLPADFELEF